MIVPLGGCLHMHASCWTMFIYAKCCNNFVPKSVSFLTSPSIYFCYENILCLYLFTLYTDTSDLFLLFFSEELSSLIQYRVKTSVYPVGYIIACKFCLGGFLSDSLLCFCRLSYLTFLKNIKEWEGRFQLFISCIINLRVP